MSSLPSSSSASSSISGHKYDVFLSFRGEDTRKKFTDHLYAALRRKGFETFRDDPDLKRGEEIKPELLKAIQESWCSVIVLSETYALSGWCLEELAEILKQKKERGHKVFPIFYEVDPSHLRNQTGKVGEAFAKHDKKYNEDKDKTKRWRTALSEVTNISGWDSKDRHEAEFIEFIVKEIYLVAPRQLIGPIFTSKDFMPFESSNLTFIQIINVLNTNGLNMIGLYGMPGVGKTTLAKEVLKHAIEQKLFDTVVMVTMSQNPEISKIQDRIAESLRLKFGASTEEGKAVELWQRLKAVNKILIIIDDIWNEYDLQTIGIPFGIEHQGCKILLTMRLQQVCVQMGCQEKFELRILSDSEAWALFKDKADLNDDASTLNEIAREVASECKGLPLAIVTIGKALKGENLEGWKAANKRFKDSRHLDNEDVCEGLYNRLLLSYDYLKGDNIRSCFLLCSLFREDFDIGFESLIMLGYGLGLFSGISSFEDLRMEIVVALKKLQDSGLLLKPDDRDDDVDGSERYVRMHDVIRDFAHWITLKKNDRYVVKEGLVQWPIRERFGCCYAISFWNSYVSNFPDRLDFPKLEILLFIGKALIKVPSAFVEGMKVLRVLRLKNVAFSLKVLKFLTNLRTLCFEDCKLKSITSLKKAKNLEILALHDTNIHKLPAELVALRRLKALHFSYRGKSHFSPNLLSRLTSLEELHVLCENNINLSELNSLSGLTTLSLRVSTDQCFQESVVFSKLQRYIVAINEELRFMEGLNIRTLRIAHFSSSFTAFKEQFCNVGKLTLWNVEEHKNIVPNIDQKGLNELSSLELIECQDMECLMDTTGENWPATAFSNLLKLYVESSTCLKELCHGPPPIRFLQKLKDVRIEFCRELKVIFPMDEHPVKEEISQTSLLSNLTSLVLCSLPNLESIWKLQPNDQYHASLHRLKVVTIEHCDKLKSIFSSSLTKSLLHLHQLHVYLCVGLEYIFDFHQEMAELEVPPLSNLTNLELKSLPALKWIWKGPPYLVNLKSLKTMIIVDCLKLGYLFSTTLARTLVDLQVLHVENCDSLEHLIIQETENEDEIVSIVDGNFLRWPKLKTLYIRNCKSLKYVFPITLAQGLPNLEFVQITDCSQLKHVFSIKNEKGGHRQQDILGSLVKNLENWPLSIQREDATSQADLKDIPLHDSKELLCNAKNLTMDGVMYHRNVFSQLYPERLKELTSLTLKDGKELECLIDTTEGHVSTDAFSNLVELVIQNMTGFKMLCNGPFPKGFLQKLQKLETRDCMELISLSPALQSLKKVTVVNCGQLQEVIQMDEPLPVEESQAPLLSNLTSLELKSLPELKWLWKGPTHFVGFRRLKIAEINGCNRLKCLFSPSIAKSLELLEQLKIVYCDELEHIIVEPDGGHLHPPFLPKLTSLEISDCPRLKYVFKIHLSQGLPQLKFLSITDSPQLKQVFAVAKEKNGVEHASALPSLQHLRLENLINLSCFSSENHPIVSRSLDKLIIVGCPRLENFTTQQEVSKHAQLRQKIIIKVSIHCNNSRRKAFMVAALTDGVISVAIGGRKQSNLVIIGYEDHGIDILTLMGVLRKKFPDAKLQSVFVSYTL